MKQYRRISDEQAKAIRNLYKTRNFSFDALMKKYDVSMSTICDILANRTHQDPEYREQEVGFNQPKLTDMVGEILEMRTEKKTWDAIGRELAIAHDRVSQKKKHKPYSGNSVKKALQKYLEGNNE